MEKTNCSLFNKQFEGIDLLLQERKFNEVINQILPVYVQAHEVNNNKIINCSAGYLLQAYYALGDYRKAFHYGNHLLKSLEGELTIRDSKPYFYVALLYYELDELEKAEYFMNKIIDIEGALENPYEFFQIKLNLALICINQKKQKEAKILLDEIKLKISELESPKEIVIYFYHLLACRVYILSSDLDQAKRYLDLAKASKIYQEDDKEQLVCLMTKCYYYEALGQTEMLVSILERGYHLAIECDNKPYQHDFLKIVYKHRSKVENLVDRLKYIEAYISMTDELQSIKHEIYEKGLSSLLEKYELYNKVNIDYLTGLKNRACVETYIEHLADYNNIFCIIFDIDDFKKINDTYGHQVGDVVIREVGNVSQRYFGDIGIVSRFGGDEFLILIKNENLDLIDVREIAENMLYSIETLEYEDIDDAITVSLGIATSSKIEIQDISDLIYQADMNLYQAKRNGKNQIF